MVSANGLKCAICYDSICCDSTKYESIKLTCGHAFGKSCIRKWVESSNQKKCLLCPNQLTDYEIKAIKNIPLQERVVMISEKTIKLFGRTILWNVPPLAAVGAARLAVGPAIGATEFVTWCVLGAAGWAAGAAAGAAGAAVGVGRATGVAVGAIVGAVGSGAVGSGAVGVVLGASGANAAYDEQKMNPVVV